jgi:hypothetical protein
MQDNPHGENAAIIKRLQKYVSETADTLVDISTHCHISRVTLGRIIAGSWKGNKVTSLRMDHFLKGKGY